MFELPEQLLLGLVTGIGFGFLLQKGRVAKYHTILGQLLLKDWTVVKVMTTAIVIGAAGVYALVALGAARLDIWPLQVAGVLIGAVLFGIGLAVFGYCPGTGMAGSGEGSRDAMIGVVGMIMGAGVFVAAYNWLEPLMLALGDLGKLTIPDVLAVSPWIVIVALAAVVAIALGILEAYERRTTSRSSREGKAAPRRRLWGWPGRARRPLAGG
jgi:uncharacterized membrane protein YedE/YeeE